MSALPLAGKRVLITRAEGQAGGLKEKLQAAGAEVIAIPAIEIVPPDSYAALDAALDQIASYDWLVLTSANAVRAISVRAQQTATLLAAASSLTIAAIGKATADAITELGLTVALIPPQAVAESLADALAPRVKGKRVLLIRALVARDVLPEALKSAGADVTIAEAYQTIVPASSVESLRMALQTRIDAIIFSSASSVSNLSALVRSVGSLLPYGVKKISIGPITTQAVSRQGWSVDAEAESASMESVVKATILACSS